MEDMSLKRLHKKRLNHCIKQTQLPYSVSFTRLLLVIFSSCATVGIYLRLSTVHCLTSREKKVFKV